MTVRSKAPLRLGLAGGGTDVSPYCDMYGGMVLNATIDMYVYCTIESIDGNRLEFEAADLGRVYDGPLESNILIDGNLDLHKGVYNRIVRDFNNSKALPIRMTTHSDAPAGSGLGTSSTLVVAMITAFSELLGLPLGEYDIAHLAYEIERIDLALSGGKQDQYAATFGGFNFMEFYKDERVIVNPLRIRNSIIDELEVSLLLYYTGASRESAKIIDEQMKNVSVSNSVAINAMHELRDDAVSFKEAILKGNMAQYAKLTKKTWLAKKQMASSISSPAIENAYGVAISAGALAGKVSGAGGGGFIMFVVDPVKRIHVSKQLSKLEGVVMNFHFTKYGTKSWRI